MIEQLRDQRGQAAVELLAALPLAAVVVACGWQLVIAGQSRWTAGEAARVAARTLDVETARSGRATALARARSAARRLLPTAMRAGSDLSATASGDVRLQVRTQLTPPFSTIFARGPRFTVRAGFR
ncbi:MAG: hypothetical protein HY827_07575 [Actinobacteria bacterium]|nr:hypothetical protein [Actinomycetota bacterium]